MAWTDQCRIAFKANAEGILHKRGGKGITKVLRQLSKESGIPFNTLRNWYYLQKKSTKNGMSPQIPIVTEPNQTGPTQTTGPVNTEQLSAQLTAAVDTILDEQETLCPVCNVRQRERKRINGEWHYYPFCKKCRIGDTDITIICPHCNKPITIKRKEVL